MYDNPGRIARPRRRGARLRAFAKERRGIIAQRQKGRGAQQAVPRGSNYKGLQIQDATRPMIDTSTAAGREKRTEQLAEGYKTSGNFPALVRLVGLSNSDRDYSE